MAELQIQRTRVSAWNGEAGAPDRACPRGRGTSRRTWAKRVANHVFGFVRSGGHHAASV